MVREVLSLGVVQCGVQFGHEVWQQYNAEHGMSENQKHQNWLKNGPTKQRDDGEEFRVFYQETESGGFVPRNTFIDTQPKIFDKLRNSDCRWMYSDSYLLRGKEDTGGNFAAGHYTVGKEMMDALNDALRKQVEECDNVQGFIMTHSVGGGTGSGLGTLILERLAVDYRKKSKMGFEVYPSPVISSSVVEPYNALLATHRLLDHTQVSLVFDNEAVYELCQRKLDIKRPSYNNLNRLIAKPIAGMTSSVRFDGERNVDLNEFQTNLVPFPRLHFVIPSFAPIVSAKRMPNEQEQNVQAIAESCLSASNFFVKCPEFDLKEEWCQYNDICLHFRGESTRCQFHSAMAEDQQESAIRCMGFDTIKMQICFMIKCPNGFTIALNERSPTVRETDGIAACKRTCTSIANNVCMEQFFRDRVTKKYDLLYSRRAFVHWFVGEGMEEGEFAEAREDLGFMEKDYRDVYSSQATDESYEDEED